jgi:hypothetical protein
VPLRSIGCPRAHLLPDLRPVGSNCSLLFGVHSGSIR